jgi:hypothetical protein
LFSLDHGEKGVKAYAIHPGAVLTDLSSRYLEINPHFKSLFIETPELSAWTEGNLIFLYNTSQQMTDLL